MAPVILKTIDTDDPRDAVHLAVQALAEGRLVAAPTETVYGVAASALDEGAVKRLMEAKGRPSGQPLTLSIKSSDDALDYVPDCPPLARRLARRCWPGPITLVVPDQHPDSLLGRLPAGVRRAVAGAGTVGLRVPAHPIMLSILRLSAGPLVLTSANRSGHRPAVTAEQASTALGEHVSLVLDDGRSKFAQPSSVVEVAGRRLRVLRQGVVSEQTVRRLASFMVLLVCTGNTCRSPMAEALLKRRLAERLGCAEDALEDRGVMVASAGIAAMAGGRATAEAVDVMRERGLDLSGHESQPVSERLVRFADQILAMTRGHREAIVARWPEAAPRTALLGGAQGDVPDPIGGTLATYRQCAERIDQLLGVWVERFAASDLPQWPAAEQGKND